MHCTQLFHAHSSWTDMIMSDEHLHVYMYIPSYTHFIINIIIIPIISVLARCFRRTLFVEQRDGPWRFVKKWIYIYKYTYINGYFSGSMANLCRFVYCSTSRGFLKLPRFFTFSILLIYLTITLNIFNELTRTWCFFSAYCIYRDISTFARHGIEYVN